MRQYRFVTVDVFTERRFGGNQLAVLPEAGGLTSEEMQSIAAEFNFSETAFVLPPENPANMARVRIFHRTAEMPFAGHPNIGTAFVLAADCSESRLVFEELAGLVTADVRRSAAGVPLGATITAPQPLTLGEELTCDIVSACASLRVDDIVVAQHQPRWSSTGTWFILAEVRADALGRAQPDLAAFQRAAAGNMVAGRLSLYLYARGDDVIRTRMFAPLSGTIEDAATGSAAASLAGLLLALNGSDSAEFDIAQGVEIGRPSRLRVTARRQPQGIVATVGGACIAVTRGHLSI